MSNDIKQRGTERKLVTRLEDIPETFESREAEAEWWDRHDVAAELLESGPEVRAELFRQLGIEDPQDKRSLTVLGCVCLTYGIADLISDHRSRVSSGASCSTATVPVAFSIAQR